MKKQTEMARARAAEAMIRATPDSLQEERALRAFMSIFHPNVPDKQVRRMTRVDWTKRRGE